MPHTPEIKGAGVVVLGSFSPQVFQPAWFARYELIPDSEADEAEIQIVHPQIVSFSTSRFEIKVEQNRLSVISAVVPSHSAIRDLVIGLIDLVPHTPMTAIGINAQYHFRLASREDLDAIGFALAPPDNWTNHMSYTGMEHLRVQGQRNDRDRPGMLRVTVQPSTRTVPGVYIEVNDHYALQDQGDTSSTEQARDVLNREWDSSLGRSDEVAQDVRSLR